MTQLLTTASVLLCPHGGMVSVISANARSTAQAALARSSDTFTIAGCPFNIAGGPHPCVRVQWMVSATRVKAVGDLALNTNSVGLCLAADGAPQGAVMIQATQPRGSGH
ncbi:MAG TPA: hypothetical protein VFE68_04030 [Vicinamibacteria bacterium]|jgi:hypothetical protein|nr:hypothetical protein [Vicinamibacteria bacterium]